MATIDFPPLFSETLDRIRARLNADANPGLSPSDPAYLDTTQGGFWYDLTQAPALEMERLWDSLNELAASMFLPFAWGVYLDLHGTTLALPRKDASPASGTVTFSGAGGTVIAAGVQVATVQVSGDADPIVFQTAQGAVIPVGGVVDVPVVALEAGSGSNVTAGSVSVLLSPVPGVQAITNAQAVTGGADVESDELYRQRLIAAFAGAHGGGTIDDYEVWALAEPGVGFVKVEPLWAGDGTVRVIVTDADNNPVSQQVIDSLQTRLDPAAATTVLTADANLPLGNGILNVGSTSGFLTSGKVVVAGSKVLSYTGKTAQTFTGVSGGTGTALNGSEVAQSGLGHGLAPIGAVVTVATPQPTTVNAAADASLDTGYSLDGTGGTINISDDIAAAVTGYLDSLRPGDPAVLAAVIARIMDVNGVTDVNTVTLNGSATNVVVASLQVIEAGTVTIT